MLVTFAILYSDLEPGSGDLKKKMRDPVTEHIRQLKTRKLLRGLRDVMDRKTEDRLLMVS